MISDEQQKSNVLSNILIKYDKNLFYIYNKYTSYLEKKFKNDGNQKIILAD